MFGAWRQKRKEKAEAGRIVEDLEAYAVRREVSFDWPRAACSWAAAREYERWAGAELKTAASWAWIGTAAEADHAIAMA